MTSSLTACTGWGVDATAEMECADAAVGWWERGMQSSESGWGELLQRDVCAGGRIHFPPKDLSVDSARLCPPATHYQLASVDKRALPPSTQVVQLMRTRDVP
jgi:hypothetical protein